MKQIDWTKWSSIAEILSAIAIVVTLIYLADQTNQLAVQTDQLALQTEQNNELLEAQARFNHKETRSNFNAIPRDNGEFAEILVKSDRGDELTAVEQLRLDSHWDQMFTAWEWEFIEFENGRLVLPVEGWRDSMSRPSTFDRWGRVKHRFRAEFSAWVDENVTPE